jgi:hypothetical protein
VLARCRGPATIEADDGRIAVDWPSDGGGRWLLRAHFGDAPVTIAVGPAEVEVYAARAGPIGAGRRTLETGGVHVAWVGAVGVAAD